MPSINDYINQLKTDKADLVDNLEFQGVHDITGDETFTELVPKVLEIPAPNLQRKNIIITENEIIK